MHKIEGKRVAFLTLGCKVNSYETEGMRELFLKAGAEETGFDREADIYVVNTCSVTNMADRKSRQMLHRAKKKNPEALVVAAGCYVQAAGEKLAEEEGIDLIVGNNQKARIVELTEEVLAKKEARLCALLDIGKEKDYEEMVERYDRDSFRVAMGAEAIQELLKEYDPERYDEFKRRLFRTG